MPHARTIAIGDIHGCCTALETLLAALDLSAGDTVVMLGDAIDRGPNSQGVLDSLLALRETCQLVPILGNHEQMLLEAIDGQIPLQDWLMHGGAETLDSYGKDAALGAVPQQHIEFLRTWVDYYETPLHFFVHGNYLPRKHLSKQPWDRLRWASLREITPAAHRSGKTAILGHTSDKQGEIQNLGHLICIDTYCYGGHWLTALDPNSKQVWQSNERGELRESVLPPPQSD